MSDEQARRAVTVRALADHLQVIAGLSERISHAFAGAQGVNATDFRALGAIYRAELAGEPLTATGLARMLNLRRSTVTYALDRLEVAGHARRERDPSDGRRVVLRYGQVGLDVASRFFGPLALAHGRAMEEFSDDELAAAERVLRASIATLQRFEAELADGARHDGGG